MTSEVVNQTPQTESVVGVTQKAIDEFTRVQNAYIQGKDYIGETGWRMLYDESALNAERITGVSRHAVIEWLENQGLA